MSRSCFVFVFGINGIFACLFKKDIIKNISFFDIHSEKTIDEISNEVYDYLLSVHRCDIKIVVDGISQSFISKSVLKSLNKKDLKQFLSSKLSTDLKAVQGALKNARLINLGTFEKTNEYILSSVALDPSFSKILNTISSSHHRVVSYHSSAAEIHDIAIPSYITPSGKPLKRYDGLQSETDRTAVSSKKTSQGDLKSVFTYDSSSRTGTNQSKTNSRHWIITISMLETSGLRTIVSVGNSIILTKVKRVVGHNFAETSSLISAEIENVITYVEKSSTLPRSKIFINIFGSRDFISIVEAISPNAGNINMFLMQDYISQIKHKTISKEYNYPAILTIAYKVYKQPFISYIEKSIIFKRKISIAFNITIFASIAIFVSVNIFNAIKLPKIFELKKEITLTKLEIENIEQKFINIKKEYNPQVLERNLTIAKFFNKKLYESQTLNDFEKIINIIKPYNEIEINSIEFETIELMPSVFKLRVSFENQANQNTLIEKIKDNQFGYKVFIENFNQETGEASLTFEKDTI